MTISIFCEKSKLNKNNFAPLEFRFYYDGKTRKVSTGLKCHVDAWKHDSQKAIIRGGMGKAEVDDLNGRIIERLAYITNIPDEYRHAGKKASYDDIRREYKAKVEGSSKSQTGAAVSSRTASNDFRLSAYMDYYIERIKKTKSPNTVSKFNSVKKRVLEFSGDILLSQVDYDFITEFEADLIESDYLNNYIHSIIKDFKTVIRSAARQGCKIQDDCLDYKVKNQRATPIWLTWEEVSKLANFKDFERPNDEVIRDLFIFRCYTGIRKSDEVNFKKHNIKKIGHHYYVNFEVVKTDKAHEIALNKKALAILQKYEMSLPYVSEYENSRIKKIAEASKLTRIVEKTSYTGSTAKVKTEELHKFISTHTARRTFARRWADAGGSIIDLSKYLAHSSVEITMRYIGYDKQEVNKSMLALFD